MKPAELAVGGEAGVGASGLLRNAGRLAALAVLAVVELALCLSLFGPQLLAWLWIGSQVDYATDSLGAGLGAAFVGVVSTMIATVWLGRRLDYAWRALHARPGRLGLFEGALVLSTAIAVIGFTLWFLVFAGPGPSISPRMQ